VTTRRVRARWLPLLLARPHPLHRRVRRIVLPAHHQIPAEYSNPAARSAGSHPSGTLEHLHVDPPLLRLPRTSLRAPASSAARTGAHDIIGKPLFDRVLCPECQALRASARRARAATGGGPQPVPLGLVDRPARNLLRRHHPVPEGRLPRRTPRSRPSSAPPASHGTRVPLRPIPMQRPLDHRLEGPPRSSSATRRRRRASRASRSR